jgi:transcriptional regulator with XRE-family HTH domain
LQLFRLDNISSCVQNASNTVLVSEVLVSELAKVRRSKGYSQRALAEAAGVSPSSVYEIEVGRRRPNPGTLRKIAGALGVEVVDLLEEEERPKASSRLEIFELPGLDAALERKGMSRGELSLRAGMTPGEILDYEIGAKKPDREIADRLADALDVQPYELIFPPEQVEARRAEEETENRWATEKRLNMSASEILEARSSTAFQRIREAYEKNDAERQAERDREDRPA